MAPNRKGSDTWYIFFPKLFETLSLAKGYIKYRVKIDILKLKNGYNTFTMGKVLLEETERRCKKKH